jgi:glycerol-3-phosphate dehydrogenase
MNPAEPLWQAVGDHRMTRPLTAFDRAAALERLRRDDFDVLVIGGGITGAGVALDAAARGLRTALVERGDFASGTSSKSSKLVHGGLRYLEQREFGLVHENLVERHRLLHNAPHLVEPLTFLIPLFGKGGTVDKAVAKGYSTALWLYDLAGGWRIGKRHRRVSAAEIQAHFPTLRTDRIVAGFLYYDARTDDARLTLSVLRTAVLDHGATALNYAPVVRLLKDDRGIACGAVIRPAASIRSGELPGLVDAEPGAAGPGAGEPGAAVEIRARVVVNATGIWADEVRHLDTGENPAAIRPAKGIHIMVPQEKLPCDMAAIVPVPKDRRAIFVVPWGTHTYLGTTDTDYDGPLDDPQVDEADIEYVLRAVNAAVSEPLSAADVTGTWAGLRPLLAPIPGSSKAQSERTADLSRRHKVLVSHSGVVTITGGKLTTYRKMAEDTLDEIGKRLEQRLPACPTRRLRLRGADGAAELSRPGAAARHGLGAEALAELVGRYGGEARAVLGLVADQPDLAAPLIDGLPYLAAEAVYAARYEMAASLEDVLSRRTRALLLDAEATGAAADRVAGLLAAELGWSPEKSEDEARRFERLVARDLAGAEKLRARS